MLVYVAVRLTQKQVEALDQYAQKYSLARGTAARSLLARQLKYEGWVDQRKARNLPPYPSSRNPKFGPPSPELVGKISDQFRQKFGVVPGDETLSRYIAGSRSELQSFVSKIRGVVRRAKRERTNQEFERDMSADFERQSSGGDRS